MIVSGGCSNEEDPSLDAAVLRSNHKEADTRFVLHEIGHIDNVVVSARDACVLLLLMAHRAKLSSKVWTWAGNSKKPKYIPLEEVSANLPRNSSSAFLQFHAITGCDSTSFTDLWTFKEDCVDGEHFDLLSSVGEDVLDADTIASAEKFACRMYKTSEGSFDLACVVLLGNIRSPEKLTPTSDAFKQHLERRHYQTAVWGQARIQKPVLPNPEETDSGR